VRTVVLAQIPGAVVMPWRDSVDGIMALFLGGQETGSAWADVIFGDHAPTGRLPLLMPATEKDTIPPSSASAVVYSEGMATSYRNKEFVAAFPFGHGLTYTNFTYLSPSYGPCDANTSSVVKSRAGAVLCIFTQVRNNGARAARTVAQLYLGFPHAARHPAPLLKGFRRTGMLLPGATQTVSFSLTAQDLSYYDAGAGTWRHVGEFTAHIGESSTDIRQTLPVAVISAVRAADAHGPGALRRLSSTASAVPPSASMKSWWV